MAMSIVEHECIDDLHHVYEATLFDDHIETLVTQTPSFVDSWISDIEFIYRHRLHRLIVGLDVEWRPTFNPHVYNRAATIQLCVGLHCLIFQLIHAPSIPQSLVDFLTNPAYTFVGVGIASDVEKLGDDYGLSVATTVDLRSLAAQEYGMRELRNAGLKDLAMQVLHIEVEKPRRITMSRWDDEWLTAAQVMYACIDAFLSFEIGRCLNAA